jgi:hypothetical protein
MIKSTIKRLETLLKGSKDFSLTEKKAILKEVSKGVKQKPELQDRYKDICTLGLKRFYLCPNCRNVQYKITRAAEREDKNNASNN